MFVYIRRVGCPGAADGRTRTAGATAAPLVRHYVCALVALVIVQLPFLVIVLSLVNFASEQLPSFVTPVTDKTLFVGRCLDNR